MIGTTDIWFASFLLEQGYKVEKFQTLKRRKGRYFFDLDQREWDAFKIEFQSSSARQYKMHHISLKDLLY